MSIFRLWGEFVQDVRYAVRTMARQPLFTAMAALSLALGIGANTAIYSFMDAILMRSLPVEDPESLAVYQWHSKDSPPIAHSFDGSNWKDPRTGHTSGNFPWAAFELFAADNPAMSHTFAFKGAGRLNVQIHGQADLAIGQHVTGAFFNGLGVRPAAGRLIDATDDRAGAPAVAVASFGYAQRRFGDAAKAVGQPVLINDNPFTIVGVAAPEFFGVNPPGPNDIYLPMRTTLLLDRAYPGDPNVKYTDANYFWVQVMGRLRPGRSLAAAQAALVPRFQQLMHRTATNDKERGDPPALFLKEGAGGLDFLRRQYSKPLYVLMTLVGLILAIACANMANLLLARATARRREMAVRLSLGAGRLRVVRQLLTESVLLSSLGALLGLAFAQWGVRALTLLLANGRENFTLNAGLNWNVLAVTSALALATGLLFGLAPALQAARVDLVPALKQTRAGGDRVRRFRVSLTQALAAAQIAISLLLLVAAGLFVRTLTNLHSIAVGFNREKLLLVSLNARQAGYSEEALMRFYHDLQKRFSGIPGVRNVSFSSYALVSGSMSSTSMNVPGHTGERPNTAVVGVGPGFLTTMQIPLLLGRDIEERDIGGTRKVAVVNELFAKKYFGSENPIGRRFGIGGTSAPADLEIVGVAKTARLSSLKQDIPPVTYFLYSQHPKRSLGQMVYALRAAGDPFALAGAAQQAVRQADARIPISRIVTQEAVIEQTIGQERTFAMLCTCFAALALAIACVGLYGMMAYRVARRTNEIGIRMALGAGRRRLIWMVLREVVLIAAVGLAIGLPAAWSASKLVESFLFQMKPNDPLTLALAPLTLLAAAILAGYAPAWRASRIDPWAALRDE